MKKIICTKCVLTKYINATKSHLSSHHKAKNAILAKTYMGTNVRPVMFRDKCLHWIDFMSTLEVESFAGIFNQHNLEDNKRRVIMF